MSEQFLDCIGVPEFFANTVSLEDAGSGMVRAIYTSQHGSILIPVCCVVRPLPNILRYAPMAVDFCKKLMLEEIRSTH